jgi:two-component system, sensor histidine kinase
MGIYECWLCLWGVGLGVLCVASNIPHLVAAATNGASLSTAEQLRLFIELAPAGIAIFDRDMRFIATSRRFAEDYGVPSARLVGRCLYDVFPEISERWRAIHNRCLAGAIERCDEDIFPRANGALDWVEWEIRPWQDMSGAIGGIALTAEIITRRKQIEAALGAAKAEAESANLAKSKFLAAASHDLRQPFQAMRLFLDLLGSMDLEAKVRRPLGGLANAVAAGEELLVTLLSVSALEAGTIQTHVAPFPVHEMLAEIQAEHCGIAAERGLRLQLSCPAVSVVSDRVLLKRMIRNLVHNALRYTEQGGILIAGRRRGDHLVVQVWDTGDGIPADKLAAIFGDSYQMGNVSHDGSKGLGLGLLTVQRMGRLLDHPVEVVSRLGRGSVFSIAMPLACGS